MASLLRLALAAISLCSLLIAVVSTALEFQGSTTSEATGPDGFAQSAPPGIRLLPRAGSVEAAPDTRLTGVIPVIFPVLQTERVWLPEIQVNGNGNPVPALGASAVAEQKSNQRSPDARRALPPVEVKIPRLSVDSKIVPVTTTPNRQVDTTDDARTIAWYSEGVAPGDNGVAMLAGHRDWAGVRGSFFSLSNLRVGDTITTVAADGSETSFVVWQSELYPTANAPAGEILRQDGPPSLVLVTCEGAFDTYSRDYTHRRVVLAIPPALAG